MGAFPSWCALQLDCTNAFNTAHRRGIHRAVYEDFPELLSLTESCCRHEPWLGWRGADGQFRWVRSAEGTQQGDPLGPFFMAAPLQPVLKEVLRAHPDVYIIAYLDDIHILGDPAQVRAAYDAAVPLLAGIGLDLNPHMLLWGALEHDSGIQRCLQEVAVALSQLPTRWGGLGLTSAQRLGSWAHVWKRVTGMFPVMRRLLHHLEAPEGTGGRGAPSRGGPGLGDGGCARGEDEADSTAQARLLSLSRDGATWHLNALPMEGGFRLKPIASVISLCLQLGVTLPLVREVFAVGTGRCRCDGAVYQFGYHFLVCNRTGMFTYRHDAVQDVLVEMLRKVFDLASVKKTHGYHRSYLRNWRPDITVLNYDGRGRHLIIDVVIGFPCADTYMGRASQVPLFTGAEGERQKVRLYDDVSPHRLVPFVVETFGGLGVQAKKFLEECAGARQDRHGPEVISAMWSTPTCMSYWGQKIMVALQGAQAFGLHSRALADFPQ
eukprot:gene9499-biopygen9691